jgi:alkanesulfonate monooxygenase SsuD/methylene tetrahydromethanopterin reductase-like flavin-dependent oxidoreductase (luciferase family)
MSTIDHRIGFVFRPSDARTALDTIVRAEAAGFGTVWTVMPALNRDTMTIFAAAAVQTERIRLGTAIVPAFTRHPLALVTQVLAIEDLAPGRLRLGIGTSHQRTMIAAYGFDFSKPLSQLRDYLAVLRPALESGKVDHDGPFYTGHGEFPIAPKTPIIVSALRENAWELAGELSDGGMSWITPPRYLAEVARPAMARGAAKVGRQAPPLLAHTFVSASTDRAAVIEAVRANLTYYVTAPFYQRMFAAAGYPLGPGNHASDALIESLTVSGNPKEIRDGLQSRLDSGLDELLIDAVPMINPVDDQAAVFAAISEVD